MRTGEAVAGRQELPWSETISEWVGCAGVGLVPAFAEIFAVLTDPRAPTEALLQPALIEVELMLFFLVTMTASVVVYVSKQNLIGSITAEALRLPTALIYLSIPAVLGLFAVFVGLRTGNLQGGLAVMSVVNAGIGALVVSLLLERKIGVIAHRAARRS
jgi:hypothetical protein